MTDIAQAGPDRGSSSGRAGSVPRKSKRRLRRRYAAERRFKLIGLLAVLDRARACWRCCCRRSSLRATRRFVQTTIAARHRSSIRRPSIRTATATRRRSRSANYAQLIRVALAEAFPERRGAQPSCGRCAG